MIVSTKQLSPALAVVALALGACSSSSDMGSGQIGNNGMGIPVVTPGDSSSSTAEPVTGAANTTETPAGSATVMQTAAEEASFVAAASSVDCEASPDEFKNTMLAVVNNSRKVARMCGANSKAAVGTVAWSDVLTEAALLHAQDMVNVNFFDHTGSDGLGVSERADGVGYNWRAIGENIAAGQIYIEEVHQGWLDSAGHCRNIMNTMFTEVGAACLTTDNADYQSYWVVVFGDQL